MFEPLENPSSVTLALPLPLSGQLADYDGDFFSGPAPTQVRALSFSGPLSARPGYRQSGLYQNTIFFNTSVIWLATYLMRRVSKAQDHGSCICLKTANLASICFAFDDETV